MQSDILSYGPSYNKEGDIKGCFDNISHQWLLDNIPMDKSILKQFLKAGYLFNRTLFPTKAGTSQGGNISLILAKVTSPVLRRGRVSNRSFLFGDSVNRA